MASHHRAQPCISAELTKLLRLFSSPKEQKWEFSTGSWEFSPKQQMKLYTDNGIESNLLSFTTEYLSLENTLLTACVPHCKYDSLLSFFIKMVAISWFMLFNRNSNFQSSLSHKHIFLLHAIPTIVEVGVQEVVLIKRVQSLQQMFSLPFQSQPHQLNRQRDTNHIRPIRPNSDQGSDPAMSWACWTDVSLAHLSSNPTQNSETTVHARPRPETEKKQAAAPRVHFF